MDLQKPFNVHDRLIRSQDSRLQQKFKLLKDSRLFLKTFPSIMQTVTIVCDTQDHSDDQHHECHDGLQGSSSTRIRAPSRKTL
jgi:hypothetical protein